MMMKIKGLFGKKFVGISIVCILLIVGIGLTISSEYTIEETEESLIDQSRGQEVLVMDDLNDAADNTSAKGMKEVVANDFFALYIDPLTTDIAVLDKEAGIFTHSNPVRGIEGFSMDDVQLGTYGAMLEMQYTNLAGKSNKYSSYTNSVLLEQFTSYKIENGVRIVYELGLDESKRILPPVLREETYKRLLEELDDDEKADFKPLFRLVKTDKIPKEEKDALIKKYPKLKTENLYILREIKKYDKNLLEDILKVHKFTIEDVEEEIAYVGFERDDTNVVFTVPVDLQIDEKGFVASIDCSYIEEPEEFKITELSVLRGFGATNEEDGFILIPDGSGILFDLVSSDGTIYSKQIYGADQIITAPYKTGNFMPSIMPVFGMKNASRAIMGVVEKSGAITNVVARSRSDMTPLACVGTEIIVNAKDYQNYGNLKTNPSGLVLPSDAPEAVVSVRYFFMNEENIDYSDMANLYRAYLIEEGVLTKQEHADQVTPLYIEMPGAIKKQVSTAGVPLNTEIALTSYKQAEEILKMFIDEGIRDFNFRYTGWVNEGIHNSVFDKIDFIKALGAKKNFQELISFAEANHINVFLDTKFDAVYEDKAFDGFEYNKDASRQLDHKVGVAGNYNPASLGMLSYGKYYIVSPEKMVQFSNSFLNEFEKNEIQTGLSLGTMGRSLNGDYKIGNNLTRERAQECYEEVLKQVKEVSKSVLVEQGNAYTWEYASDIVNLPVGGSELYAQARAIPFAQMVLHGYIDYAAMPLNLSSDLSYETLKAIETGSGIYAQMMYAEDMVVVDTKFDYMYSLNYENQWKEVASVYKNVAEVLDQVAGETITKHEELAEGVYATTYSGGKQVIVNYQNEAWQGNGVLVQGQNYVIQEVNE